MGLAISSLQSQRYKRNYLDWEKWWCVYEGGRSFKATYLHRNVKRESLENYELRKSITPIPRSAGCAIDQIIGALVTRLHDVKRTGGDDTYVRAVSENIDRSGNSIEAFMATELLPRLLVQGFVGVMVDRESSLGITRAESLRQTPYLYVYDACNILGWTTKYDPNQNMEVLRTLTLQITAEIYDAQTGVPSGDVTSYRRIWIGDDGKVWYSVLTDDKTELAESLPIKTQLTAIPFVVFAIKKSLMEDVCDHQIAELNLDSAGKMFHFGANFPLYVEQRDSRTDAVQVSRLVESVSADGVRSYVKQEAQDNVSRTVDTGPMLGRSYERGLEAPAFIAPSTEPSQSLREELRVLREQIKETVGLSLEALQTGQLDSGLAVIGAALQVGETSISKIWAELVGNDSPAVIQYPRDYSLLTEQERIDRCKSLEQLKGAVPSKTFQKLTSYEIAHTLLTNRVTEQDLERIREEIIEAKYISSSPEAVRSDLEAGIVSNVTASIARGYEGVLEVPQAKADHAERLARIQAAQKDNASRGVPDASVDPSASVKEKEASQKQPDLSRTTDIKTHG